jgi:hypothetical protein
LARSVGVGDALVGLRRVVEVFVGVAGSVPPLDDAAALSAIRIASSRWSPDDTKSSGGAAGGGWLTPRAACSVHPIELR